MADVRAGEIDWPAMLDYARSLVPWLARRYRLSDDDAEDVAGEALARVWAQRRALDPARHPRAYLAQAARNAAVDRFRRTRRALMVPWDTLERMPAAGDGPEATAERGDEAARVAAVLASLPDKHRCLLVQKHGEGRTMPDIAAEHGLPVSTVKMRLHRGRQLFRERWTA